jgi:hypothetical protein
MASEFALYPRLTEVSAKLEMRVVTASSGKYLAFLDLDDMAIGGTRSDGCRV